MNILQHIGSSILNFLEAVAVVRECNSLANAGRYQEARELLDSHI